MISRVCFAGTWVTLYNIKHNIYLMHISLLPGDTFIMRTNAILLERTPPNHYFYNLAELANKECIDDGLYTNICLLNHIVLVSKSVYESQEITSPQIFVSHRCQKLYHSDALRIPAGGVQIKPQ